MSNTLFGRVNNLNKNWAIGGIKPEYKPVPITCQSIVGQRRTEVKVIKKWLEFEGGFNWALWRPPSVAEWINADGQIVQKRWDGDHRWHMHKTCFPDTTHIDCMVYRVENESEANSLFVKIQKTRAKPLTPEQVFINHFLAGDTDTVALGNLITSMGVQVYDSPDCRIPMNGPLSNPKVKVRRIAQAMKKNRVPQMREAIDMIKNAFCTPKSHNDDHIASDLIWGLAIVFEVYPILQNNGKMNRIFRDWLNVIALTKRQSTLAKGWKYEGGNQHNREGESIACGALKEFREFSGLSAHYRNKIPLKNILDKLKND